MNKRNKKLRKAKEGKLVKKELEEKLQNVISQTLAGFGKAKKTKAIIEKFAKKLVKKVDFKPLEIKPVETEPISLAKPPVEQSKNETAAAKKFGKAKPKVETK